MSWTRKSEPGSRATYRGQHRFEHWYRDNQVYFLTARCRGRFPALACEEAKAVFWERLDTLCPDHGFTPWIVSVMDNHYHVLGYLRRGDDLPNLMRLLHGAVAKRVNDLLQAGGLKSPCLNERGRLVPFWRDSKRKNYMDGCIRDELQARRAYRYVLNQSVRHGVCSDWRDYPHTRIYIEKDRAIRRASQLNAYLRGVRYKCYEGREVMAQALDLNGDAASSSSRPDPPEPWRTARGRPRS